MLCKNNYKKLSKSSIVADDEPVPQKWGWLVIFGKGKKWRELLIFNKQAELVFADKIRVDGNIESWSEESK